MWIGSLGGLARPLDHIRASFFRGSHSLRDLFARSLGHSLGSARAGVIVVGLFRRGCGRLCPFFVRESFMWVVC
jgi:hypothetical protein